MCWSGEASATLAVGGFATAYYAYRKGEARELCAALAYFSGMEALQAYTYTVIDQCGVTGNQVATVLGYVHIAFQPFFINAVSMHFIPEALRKRIKKSVYAICAIAATAYLLRLAPISWAPFCYHIMMGIEIPLSRNWVFHVPFCGPQTCSVHGAWHIAWQIPAHYVYLLDNAYPIAGFILPLLYGAWRMTLYHLLTGPLLALLTTNDANEYAAVWCLYSIGLLSVMIKTPVRRFLYQRTWYGKQLPAKPAARPRPEKKQRKAA